MIFTYRVKRGSEKHKTQPIKPVKHVKAKNIFYKKPLKKPPKPVKKPLKPGKKPPKPVKKAPKPKPSTTKKCRSGSVKKEGTAKCMCIDGKYKCR